MSPRRPKSAPKIRCSDPLNEITNSIGLKMKLVQPGEFMMGDEGYVDPLHKVRITRPFYLGIYPVTQSMWRNVMGTNPSEFIGDDLPVEQVSWEDCQTFIACLNKLEPEGGYRLPTEAEWEYACRAGSTTRFCCGNKATELASYAWFGKIAGSTTHPVGKKSPNAWGLYDMHGNVLEWCWDWYGDSYYKRTHGQGTTEDPIGPQGGSERVLRGGAFCKEAGNCTSAVRDCHDPGCRHSFIGFRLTRSLNRSSAALTFVQPTEAPVPPGAFKLPSTTNCLGMKMQLIPKGEFMMGDEGYRAPIHKVRITKPFYLGVYPVTQREWKDVMGTNPSFFKGDTLPVERVSWEDCRLFIERLNEMDPGKCYRLPTDAEWEYACRAGSTGRYSFVGEDGILSHYVWHISNSREETHPVGRKSPNPWGLYDILGLVWEWCWDWYDPNYFKGCKEQDIIEDPKGPDTGHTRVLRGGSWKDLYFLCTAGYQNNFQPDYRHFTNGLRLARSLL